MPEFNLERFRFIWRGPWQASREYNRDDVVQYGGSSWTCTRVHTASTFELDQEYLANPNDTEPTPAWRKMTEGYGFTGDWLPATAYGIGEIVVYSGVLYVANDNHTSAAIFDDDLATYWDVYVSGNAWLGDWTPTTRYGIGDLVKYNGIVYRCNTGHQSTDLEGGLEADQASWTTVFSGVEYAGTWAPSTRYRANDLVEYGGSVLRCITGHTSGVYLDDTKFQTEFAGLKFKGDWEETTYYAVGDVILNGGYLFRSLTNNVGKSPSNDYTLNPLTPDWKILVKGNKLVGEWTVDASYKTGDLVIRGGNLYRAKEDTGRDGSSLDYLDPSYWDTILEGQIWKGSWKENNVYYVNDVVTFEGSTWICTYQHLSSYGQQFQDEPDLPSNFPGDSGSGFDYWDLLILEGPNVGMNQRGDLVYYGYAKGYINDGSTLGPTGVRKGSNGQILTVGPDSEIEYRDYGGSVNRTFFVSIDGVDDFDDPVAGSTLKPFRTIGFACRRADDGFDGTTSIFVATGRYQEQLPITVPKGTALIGDELRSTIIEPAPESYIPVSDRAVRIGAIDRVNDIVEQIILQQPISNKTSTNTQEQQFITETVTVNVSYNPPQFDIDDNEIFESSYEQEQNIITDLASATLFQDKIQNSISKINVDTGIAGYNDPTITGSVDAITDQTQLNALQVFRANIKFMVEEVIQFLNNDVRYTGKFVEQEYRAYIEDYIHTLADDYKYQSNHGVVMNAIRYASAINGASDKDMLYVRDASGVRNMTIRGLEGALADPINGEPFSRPTGGALISLDPGWGTADSRCWINTRSPYIQNVTTFGTACIGQKIDGALHDGGNKSIVSNDFTQVISDGIGAWITNNGRAELVSVFSYYAQIGYFAENGGTIRATNGNNSYGVIGALALGNNPDEVPATATLNNRDNQAVVASAFAGERNDEIFVFEMTNAGEHYTESTYTITGSGTGADVIQEDFRDKAIFESRRLQSEDSTAVGGFGFFLQGNNAQSGDKTSIVIASSSEFTEAEILGMRIIITSGEGTGQYGYIQSYNPVSKTIQVYKESNDTPGWDHVVPGWPLVEVLQTSTFYRIEPRVIFDEPRYYTSTLNASIGVSWKDIIFGETYDSRTALPASGTQSGTLEGDAVAVEARFDVVKNGRTYTVTLNDGGAGYAKGDVITISGTLIGGTSPANDITITVDETTDDSTDSITKFRYEGTGTSGKWIALPQTGQVLITSSNGANWDNIAMANSQTWKSIATADTGFVAIGDNTAYRSEDGSTWETSTMPVTQSWSKVIYADNIYVAIADDSDTGAYSTNKGAGWSTFTIPDTIGDSSFNEWVDITYGAGKFVAIAKSNSAVAVGQYDNVANSWSWTTNVLDTADDSSQADWVSVEYGNGRYVAMSAQGDIRYSFNGEQWYASEMPTQDGSTVMHWRQMKYGNGTFVAVCDTVVDGTNLIIGGNETINGRTRFFAYSGDGIHWKSNDLARELQWGAIGYGNPEVAGEITPYWIAVPTEQGSGFARLEIGTRAEGRALVEGQRISEVRLWNVGSGYTQSTAINTEFVDPNQTIDAYQQNRVGNGVLGTPSFLNRGKVYKTSTTEVTILGDGYADIYPESKFITLSGLDRLPGPGAQLRFAGNEDFHRAVVITPIRTEEDGTQTALIRISPSFSKDLTYPHNTAVTIRERYSQCRITGHDFLDIGTGNFEQTNYPELYTTGDFFKAPENEVVELEGGRVFYTSTDQDGNFRCGELFAVEQATGIVTISADFFNLEGLTELALGGVRLGGSGTVIREFSKDPFFIEDSNNIVPTQKAIKAYLTNRLNVGGADLLTASFIAGVVRVGPSEISTTTGQYLNFVNQVEFVGSDVGISGSILGQTIFFGSFNDSDYSHGGG